MQPRTLGLYVCTLSLMACAHAQAKNLKKVEFTTEFPDLADCAGLATDTVSGAQNRYWPLEINREWRLSNESCVADGECDELEDVVITVTSDTENVNGITTRVVTEEERINGILREISRNYFVECVGTEDVYYMGEDVDIYDESGEVSHEGAWRAEGDNRPGIMMPGGAFLIGSRYFQEVAPEVALDRAENKAMGLDFDDPADGTFEGCVLIEDTNALEDPKGKEGDEKIYCPGIGIVADEEMELTSCKDGMGNDCAQ